MAELLRKFTVQGINKNEIPIISNTAAGIAKL
jgi:hypothetical protein